MDSVTLFLLVGGFTGGFISGLSGFGAALVSLPILLLVVPPTVAAQVAAVIGTVGQIQTLPSLRASLSWPHVLPTTVAGLLGVAIAIWLIPPLPVALFKAGVGAMLIIYSLFALALPETWRFKKRHPVGDVLVGLAGGLAGGIAGIPGAPMVMWVALQNWRADQKRTLIQVFNIATLSFMLIASAVSGLITHRFLTAVVFVIPTAIAGAWCGVWLYRRLDDRRFNYLIIVLLLISGLAMVLRR